MGLGRVGARCCCCLLAEIVCSAYTFGNAQWPTVAPGGTARTVNGVCNSGYQPTNPGQPVQQVCQATGAYTNTVINPCVRTSKAAIFF